MSLYDWTKHYITFRDLVKRQIVKKTFLETSILVEEKKEKKIYLVMEELEDALSSLKKFKDDTKSYIITLNTNKNCTTLIDNWKEFSKYKQLTIIFFELEKNEK